jgi:hypothetical protein
MDLYPRTHVISDGRVFISGPLESTWAGVEATAGARRSVALITVGYETRVIVP